MNDTKKKELEAIAENEVEWGETHQERIVDDSPRNKSERHTCKGRGCKTAFEKL